MSNTIPNNAIKLCILIHGLYEDVHGVAIRKDSGFWKIYTDYGTRYDCTSEDIQRPTFCKIIAGLTPEDIAQAEILKKESPNEIKPEMIEACSPISL